MVIHRAAAGVGRGSRGGRQEYAESIGSSGPRAALERGFWSKEVDLRFGSWTRRYDSEWEEVAVTVHVRKQGSAALTNAELLLRLHEAAFPLLQNQDHHFFEGLRQIDVSREGVPVFEVILGS